MRDSEYNLAIQDNEGRTCLFNTRCGLVHVMTAHEYESYRAAADGLGRLEDVAGTLICLVRGGFLVEDGEDELREIEAAHRAARTSREKLSLVIASSMACNLDCPYCFEMNKRGATIRDDTQANALQLVRQYFEGGTKRLAVTWYGGEPLLAFRAIGRLSGRFISLCNEFGCAYSADIVTNGTLLTADKARQLASWNVKQAQISLDGLPDLHDKRRAKKNGGPTFEKVVQAIEIAADYMNVSIRINACRQVAASVDALLRLLAERGINRKASVYVAPLRALPKAVAASAGARQGPAASEGPRGEEEIRLLNGREAAEVAIYFDDLLRKYGFPTHPNGLPRPRNTACIADQDHSWLIEPDGTVQKCDWTVGIGAEAVGHIAPAGITFSRQYRKWRQWSAFAHRDCASCVMLPLCLAVCPLAQMNNEGCCPPFKYNWERVLARSVGFPANQVKGLPLTLGGCRIRQITTGDVARLAFCTEQHTVTWPAGTTFDESGGGCKAPEYEGRTPMIGWPRR